MGCLQAALEIRECLHKLSHIFARSGIDRAPGAQMHHQACEHAFGSAYRLEREMYGVVARACEKATSLIAQKRTEIDMFEDERRAFDVPVEMSSRARAETHFVACLIVCKREKPDEQYERNEDEDE